MTKVTIETVPAGWANGISTQLNDKLTTVGEFETLTEQEKEAIIQEAAIHFGNFLTALGVDWKNDPNSNNTPLRVAKAYVNDLWAGRYNSSPVVTTFPSDGYTGIVFEGDIPLVSMCSHHHQSIMGIVNIAYIPRDKLIGLSKLNRIVEHFSRRGAIQEQLTQAIHEALDKIIAGNGGIAVHIRATHNCVSCRGVKHVGASMQTAKLSGGFRENEATRAEFYQFLNTLNK